MKKDEKFVFQKKVEFWFSSLLTALLILLSAKVKGRYKMRKKETKECSDKKKRRKGEISK